MPVKLQKASQKRPTAPLPTPAETRLLHILWENEAASVEEVVNAHPDKERPNYKTTQTLLRIMEQKGLITHGSRGRVFIFRPLIDRKTIDQRAVRALLSRNFGGSAAGLLINLLESVPLKGELLDELEARIREYRRKGGTDTRERSSLPADIAVSCIGLDS